MGGGHVCGQLALFFGLHQPKPSLTLSPAAPGPVSLQPSGHPAWPAFSVPKRWDVALPHHGAGHATPSNAPAGRAHRKLHGQGCCVETSICTVPGGAGWDPSRGGISADATPELASLPCRSTVGWEETATNPWHAGFLLTFIFTDA